MTDAPKPEPDEFPPCVICEQPLGDVAMSRNGLCYNCWHDQYYEPGTERYRPLSRANMARNRDRAEREGTHH